MQYIDSTAYFKEFNYQRIGFTTLMLALLLKHLMSSHCQKLQLIFYMAIYWLKPL